MPITRYCDEHHLTPRQRLELFIPVCQAVQHGHQKGIIHRDLKPSNVLVDLYDGKSVPKIIDFGVAKAAGQQLTDKTLVTGFGAIVGTRGSAGNDPIAGSGLLYGHCWHRYRPGMLSQSLITRPATFFPVLAQACSAEYTLRGTIMTAPATDETDLLRRAKEGDQQALATLFARYRDRLRKMVRLRLDRRLYGRIDTSDVLQDAYLDVARRFPEYAASPTVPFYIWLRSLTGQRLVDVHRRNLGAEMRDAGREVSLYRGPLPAASSASLAQQLLAGLTSPTQAAVRAEMQLRLHEVLNSMDPIDREVVVLRHFEELSNIEAAEVLGIETSAASKRYIRAIRRLKAILDAVPGFFG